MNKQAISGETNLSMNVFSRIARFTVQSAYNTVHKILMFEKQPYKDYSDRNSMQRNSANKLRTEFHVRDTLNT